MGGIRLGWEAGAFAEGVPRAERLARRVQRKPAFGGLRFWKCQAKSSAYAVGMHNHIDVIFYIDGSADGSIEPDIGNQVGHFNGHLAFSIFFRGPHLGLTPSPL